MPFSNTVATNAYELCIKKVCENHDLEIRRADEIFTTNPIYDDIVKEVRDASIIIVDISGSNPNVYYELGMAHTLKQNQTIIITQEDFQKTPFDIAHFRIIKYEDSIKGKETLENQLDATLKNLLTDYKTLNREKYLNTLDVFMANNKQNVLATLLGIRNYNGILKKEAPLDIEYEYPSGKFARERTSLLNNASPLIKLGFLVIIEDNLIEINEEGKVFAEFVEDFGIKCHLLNDQPLTPDYISFEDEYWKRQSERS